MTEALNEKIKWAEMFPNFAPKEIYSPDTLQHPSWLDLAAMEKLQRFRNVLNKPILVNHGNLQLRGVRSCSEQAGLLRTGASSARFSYHIQGCAFDITVPDMSVNELTQWCRDFHWTKVIPYPDKKFVHVHYTDTYEF